MGTLDSLTSEFMRDPVIFSDVFNYFIYGGERVIQPENLVVQDTNLTFFEQNTDTGITEELASIRDILKQCVIFDDTEYTYVMMGIENQANVDYLMPMRVMLYDALVYHRQIVQKKKDLRTQGDKISSRFGGVPKGTLFHGVITLVCYWGSQRWDAPRCLHDLLENKSPAILKLIPNYTLSILIPEEMTAEQISLFQSEFGLVLECLHDQHDKKTLRKRIKHDHRYCSIDGITAKLLNELLNFKLDLDLIDKKEKCNMCQAWEEILEDERNAGREEMRKQCDIFQQAAELEKARADNANLRADEEKARADEEKARADEEKARADNANLRADNAMHEIFALKQRLRDVGIMI